MKDQKLTIVRGSKSRLQPEVGKRLARVSRMDATIAPVQVLLQEVQQIEREMANEELQRARLALQKSHDLFVDLYQSAPIGYLTLTAGGSISEINLTGARLLGNERSEIIGHDSASFVVADERDRYDRMLRRVADHGEQQTCAITLRGGNDAVIHAQLDCARINAGETPVLRLAITDLTERKRAEGEIESLAFYDLITKLPNRRLFLDRLEQALIACARTRRHGAILLINLDTLKALDDSFSVREADVVLKRAAYRLTTTVRESDTVARLGGDQFVVMLQDLSGDPKEAASQALAVGKKTLDALNQQFLLTADEHRRSTWSIGATLFRDHRESVEDLLQRAERALSEAKAMGAGVLRLFEPKMQLSKAPQSALQADLYQAVKEEQFVLHYQTQVDREGRLTGLEALLRWQHPTRGLLHPGDFIPLSEETGIICAIGQWVLEAACVQLAAWSAKSDTAHLTLAINVSPSEFRDPGFVDRMLTALHGREVNPKRLMLEITESLMIGSVEETIAKMKALRGRGVRFSLDDFGTGYSSLTYLKRLPLDQLKIDQSFVRDILASPKDAAIACTIMTLGKSLGLNVIAEGIETEEQRDFLAVNGCDAYQGFLFGRPVAVEKLHLSQT